MPKRKVDRLDGLRIELNTKERELIETAIWVNGIGQATQGLGTAIAGIGIPLAAIGAVIVWKEGTEWFDNLMTKDKQKFEDEVLTQANYDAYINSRTDEWIAAASALGRYAPAIGDADNYAAWHALDPAAGVVWQPLTFEVWEMDTYGEPPLTFDQWADAQRASVTQKRRLIASTIFPPLTLLGIGQFGLKDWFTGRK